MDGLKGVRRKIGRRAGGGRKKGGEVQSHRLDVENLYLPGKCCQPAIQASSPVWRTLRRPPTIAALLFCAFALLIPTVSNTPPLHSPTLLFYHITRDVIHSHCLPFFADAICYGSWNIRRMHFLHKEDKIRSTPPKMYGIEVLTLSQL